MFYCQGQGGIKTGRKVVLQVKIILLMIRYLILAILILAVAAALYVLYSTPSPAGETIFIAVTPPVRAEAVLQIKDSEYEK